MSAAGPPGHRPARARLRSTLARRHGFTVVAGSVVRNSSTGRRLESASIRMRARLRRAGASAGVGVSRTLSAARTAESAGDWEEAAHQWRVALQRHRPDPLWRYELSRALVNLGEADDAAAECRRALESAARPADLRRLGAAAAGYRDWEVAATAYARGGRLGRDPTMTWLAGRALASSGSYAEAAEELEAAIRGFGTGPSGAYADLAEARRKLGDLDGAEAAVQAGWAVYPRSSVVHAAAARVATDRRDWPAAAWRWPEAMARRRRPAPASWVFQHGDALEHLGRFGEARVRYDDALRLLAQIDEPWAHFATLEWQFRRAYCSYRTVPSSTGPAPADPALSVEIRAATGTAAAGAAGGFAADVIHLGLRIRGTVTDPSAAKVAVAVDGREIKQVDVDRRWSRGTFAFTVRHSALVAFPVSARLSVAAGGVPLAADLGGTELAVSVPHGDGTLFDRLDHSDVFTKKGALVSRDTVRRPPQELLDAYRTVRDLFRDTLGVDVFLMYGTLLGCHRDGRFIPGDDDLDVGYVTPCTEPGEVKAQALRAVEQVLRAGFDVTTRHGGGLFKVWVGSVDIDVYPVWFRAGRAWAYDAIAALPSHYLPAQPRDMLGTEVLLPRDPDHLLAGTYGPGWVTPNPGFRYYRPRRILEVLKATSLNPSEAKRLLLANAEERRRHPGTGSFAVHDGRVH